MRAFVLIILSAFIAASTLNANAQQLGKRPPDWAVEDGEWARFNDRWISEGRPTIAVFVSEESPSLDDRVSGRIVRSDGNGANAELLASEMRSILANRLGAGSVMQTDALSSLQQRTADRIALAAGGIDKALLDEVRKAIDADIVFTIRLVPSGGSLSPMVEVLDNRNGAVLASPTADPINPKKVRWQVIYANALLKEFISQYAADNRPPPVHIFDLYVAGFDDFRDADTVFDIVDEALSASGSVQIDDDVIPVGEANFASILRIAYKGDRPGRVMRRVSRALDRGFENEYVINPVEKSRYRLSAYAYRDLAPLWYIKTDPSSPVFASEVSVRAGQIRAIAGGLRMGILVGRGIAEDWPQLEIEGVNDAGEGMPYPPADLRTALQDQFTRLGFDVRDDAATRDRIEQLARQMDRRGVSALTAETLADTDFFDILAVVALRTTIDNSVSVNARLISRADAKLLGGLVGPSLMETRPGAYRVNSGQIESISRYIAGTLAARFDSQAARLGRTVDVTVLNLQSGAEFTAIRTVLSGTPGIDKIGRSAFSIPAGTLEVITTSQDMTDIVSRVERSLLTLDFSPVIAGSSATSIVIDANPSINSTPPKDEDLIRRINAYPEDFPAYLYTAPQESSPDSPPDPSSQTDIPVAQPPLPPPTDGPRTPKSRPNAWALLIGVNEAEGQTPLRGCVGDAERLAGALIEHAGFAPERVILMTDKQAETEFDPTASNIMRAVDIVTNTLGSKDRSPSNTQVIFSFSSHGGVDENTGLTSLIARDGTPVTLEIIRQKFSEAGIDESIFIIDACQSGSPNDFKVSQSLKVADQTTLASCRWYETSAEVGPPPQGVFTTALISGLVNGAADRQAGDGDGILDLFELYKYTYRVVRHQSQGKQNPFLKLQTGNIPFIAEYE